MIGDEPFQPAILLLERFQLPRVAHFEIAIALLPALERRARDPMAADQIGRMATCRVLLQDRNDLLGREAGLLHGRSSWSTQRSTDWSPIV